MLTGEFSGRWWLPDTPSRSVHGVLTLGYEARPKLMFGPSLEPDEDPVEHLRSLFGGSEREIPLVFGRTSSGKDVTLADGRLAIHEMEWDHPDSATHIVTSSAAYVGSHFDPSIRAFPRLELSIEHLEEWRAAKAFEIAWTLDGPGPRSIDLHGEVPPDLRSELPDGELVVRSVLSNGGDSRLAPGLSLACSLRVDVGLALPITDWFKSYVGPLTRLLSLATGREVAASKVELSGPSEGEQVEVVWPHKLHSTADEKRLSPADLLFCATDLKPDGPPSIGAWLTASASYKPVMDAFFATRLASPIFEEDRFQNLIQAAEGYHRRRIGRRADQSGHTARLERIAEAVDADDRSWLLKALQHAGEYRLDERLVGLIEMHPWMASDVIIKKPRKWAAKAAAARNFRTHHDPDALPVAAKTWDLIGLSQRLSVLMESCLLLELGFSELAIEEMVKRASPAYQILTSNPL
jgi:ApeA N-terminal domain 1